MVTYPVMLLVIPVMLLVMLLVIPVMLLVMLPVMLLVIPVMLLVIPVMFSANTPVPIIGTSNMLKANVIANDKIKILAIFMRNNVTLFKYFLELS
jgi:membrane protein implicated in regulation of membrane protease activity